MLSGVALLRALVAARIRTRVIGMPQRERERERDSHTHTNTHTHTCTHARTHARTRAHTLTHIHTRTHTHSHTHTHTHTHTHLGVHGWYSPSICGNSSMAMPCTNTNTHTHYIKKLCACMRVYTGVFVLPHECILGCSGAVCLNPSLPLLHWLVEVELMVRLRSYSRHSDVYSNVCACSVRACALGRPVRLREYSRHSDRRPSRKQLSR